MLHASPTDLARARRLLPGTLTYFRWPDGRIQEAVKVQDAYTMASTGFILLDELPDNTALDDVPVIIVDEDQKWHLV